MVRIAAEVLRGGKRMADLVLTHDIGFVEAISQMLQHADPDEALELQEWIARWEDEKERLFTGAPWCLTLLDGDQAVATFGGYAAPDRVVALLLWVRSDYRLQGLGSRLIEEFVAWALRAHPGKRIRAENCNPPAQRAFAKLGFFPVPEVAARATYLHMEWQPQP